MHSHILIPVAIDHEGRVSQKIAVARQMLAPGGRITLLTVLEQIGGFVSEFVTVKSENHLSDKIRERLQSAADGDDIAVEVTTGKPGVEIARFARSRACDLIVVGSHAPGQSEYRLGSTAASVVRSAACSVYVLR